MKICITMSMAIMKVIEEVMLMKASNEENDSMNRNGRKWQSAVSNQSA